MKEGITYLPYGWEESPVPGWFFIDESDMYVGPYRTKELAEQALEWYADYLTNGPKEK